MMIRILHSILFIGFLASAEDTQMPPAADKEMIDLAVKAQEQIKVPVCCALVCSQKNRGSLFDFAHLVKKACEFTGEVSITLKEKKFPQHKKDLYEFYDQGFMRVLYLMFNEEQSVIEWRLYDPSEAEMLAGKSVKIKADDIRLTAYLVADSLWPELSGEDGFFATKIAYCIKVAPERHNNHEYKHIRHIYMSDYDGSNPVCIVDSPTLNIAPRWGCNTRRPCLYYSRCTASNMQLIELDTNGRRRVVLDAEGLNMLPSFSPSGNGVAYNHCGDIMVKRRDASTGSISFTKITNHGGNNISPNLFDNGDVIFCSDFQTKNPQIYCYHADTKELERLTNDGYCCCPSYCPKNQKILYTKLIKGSSQLYIYDVKTKKHEQLTFDATHKDEPSFSPCGNLAVFSVENRGECRIAVMHLYTKERKYITQKSEQATYPSWSSKFTVFPDFEKKSSNSILS